MPRPANAGRKKGSLNKKTVMRAKDLLAEMEVNPTAEILRIIPQLELDEQLKAWTTLLGYTEPKPKEESEDEKDLDEIEIKDVSESKLVEFLEYDKKKERANE